MNDLLYYPTILVPSNWLKKAVFFSDSISSICPYGFSPSDRLLETRAYAEMKYLESINMFKFVRPEELEWEDFDFILSELEDVTKNWNLNRMRRNYNENSPKMEIFKSKMDSEIIDFFDDIGLSSDFEDSLIVDKKIGMLYMSLLAQVFSHKNDSMSLSTSNVMNKSMLFKDSKAVESEKFLKLVFKSIPQPSNQSSLDDIVSFKLKYEIELAEYRTCLMSWLDKLNNDISITKIQNFNYEIKKFNREIFTMGKHSKIDIIFGAMETLLPIYGANEYLNIVEQGSPEQLNSALISTGISLAVQKLKCIGRGNNNIKPVNYIIRARKENLL